MSVFDNIRVALHSLLSTSASPPTMKRQGRITTFSTYHSNGRVKAEMHYMYGKRQGEWKHFDLDGKTTCIQFYEQGELVRTETPEAEAVEV